MNNQEFRKYINGIKYVSFTGLSLKITDSVGVLLDLKFKRNSNYFDELIEHMYLNYFKNRSIENEIIYMLLEALAKTVILEHCKNGISQKEFIPIEDAYTGNTEMLLVDFNDKIGNLISDSDVTNLQCKEMNIGFKQAFVSDKVPTNLENMYLMNV